MSTKVVTFGCRLNIFEGEVIKNAAAEAGLDNTIIFNSCAVTKEAERQLRQSIRKARRESPDAKIIVTGCAAQIDPKCYNKMAEVDQVIGNEEKLKPASYQPGNDRLLVEDIMTVKETASHLLEGLENKSRAFVQVQTGCDHRCTFCIIPYGRGNSRSIPIGEIVKQASILVRHGYQELVITGVDLTDYGKDLPGKPRLGQMVKRLLNLVPDLPRLRLSSIDVAEIDDELFTLITQEPRVMPHIHLSLQAGDNMILKRMKRRHNREQVIDFCHHVRSLRPKVVFGADVIAGFPTETEEMFNNTYELLKQLGFIHLHIFPYSERPGTPAARMPQVDKHVRKERAGKLRALGESRLQQYLTEQVGSVKSILVEQGGLGRAEDYTLVQLDDLSIPEGQVRKCRIEKPGTHKLYGKPI